MAIHCYSLDKDIFKESTTNAPTKLKAIQRLQAKHVNLQGN
jgi:hypothetical protein